MNKKGFTILETMVAVAIFSLLMIIVFSCWTEFQKIALKNEAKQDINVQLVNIYRNIDKSISSASIRLFQLYSDTSKINIGHKDRRWFAFMISRKDGQLDGEFLYQAKDASFKRLIYNTIVIYLLYYKEGCCEKFENCPHKSLFRYVISSSKEIYFGSPITPANLDGCDWGSVFEDDILPQVANVINSPFSESHSVVENNIVDLQIKKYDDKIRFFLTLLRTSDAERHFTIGSKKLTTKDPENDPENPIFTITNPELRKYMENLSWISVPSNT